MFRYIAAQWIHEANTFSPSLATLENFRAWAFLEGEKAVRARLAGTRSEIAGFMACAEAHHFQLAPVMSACAYSSGPLTHDTYERILERLLNHIQAALPADGILIAAHGAMVAEHELDATGATLSAIRQLVGPDMPLVVTLDSHGNVTGQMIRSADVLVGWKTYPHIDQFESGWRAAQIIRDISNGAIRPAMAMCKLPMIVPAEGQQTTHGPAHTMKLYSEALESRSDIASASVFLVQPWLDMPDTGCSVIVIAADGSMETAVAEARQFGRRLWDIREDFDVELAPLDDAIDRALAASGQPVILADSADASGAPRDSTAILKALLERQVQETCLLTVVDPQAVDELFRAGPGTQVDIMLGGKRDTICNSPARVVGRVHRLIEAGSFVFEGQFNTGVRCEMGRVAVLQAGGVMILIPELMVNTADPALYRSVGLEPQDAKIVVVKSPTLFRANYGEIAHDMILVDAPGLSSGNLRRLPFKHLTRPFFPLDENWTELPEQIYTGRAAQL
jgi:microcystin degradation protein MlrC